MPKPSDSMPLPRVTEMAHFLARRHLRPGDHAVDATAGKGHDTRFLASRVGSAGRVDGFDIQPEALAATAARVAGLPQVRLHLAGHERMGEFVEGRVAAVLFNLGYLPTGDKSRITRPATTLAALDAAMELLDEGGLLSVVVYPAHAGGAEEAEAVECWFASLDPGPHRVASYGPPRRSSGNESPRLLAATRGKRG